MSINPLYQIEIDVLFGRVDASFGRVDTLFGRGSSLFGRVVTLCFVLLGQCGRVDALSFGIHYHSLLKVILFGWVDEVFGKVDRAFERLLVLIFS